MRFVEFTYSQSTTASLDDYTKAIEEALTENGINEGWLLGESFGSQPAWALIRRSQVGTLHCDVPAASAAGGAIAPTGIAPKNQFAAQDSASHSLVAE